MTNMMMLMEKVISLVDHIYALAMTSTLFGSHAQCKLNKSTATVWFGACAGYLADYPLPKISEILPQTVVVLCTCTLNSCRLSRLDIFHI